MIEKIVSGGQTGTDRGALDAALEKGFPCGGWCPKNRRAEDGRIDAQYPLQETPADDYETRTEWNVRDSDGTLILTIGEPEGGTALTIQLAQKWEKPLLVINFEKTEVNIKTVYGWIETNNIKTLNVAGPRASKRPQIYQQCLDFVRSLLFGLAP